MRIIIIYLLVTYNIFAQEGEWKSISSMNTERWLHAAVALNNGEVLVSGGESFTGERTSSCEIYSSGTDTWRITDSMRVRRWKHSLVLLDDGRVFAIGGENELSCEIYNPITETWTLTDSLILYRWDKPRIAKLQDGNILISGGSRRTGIGKEEIYSSCEIFDIATEKWIKIANMNYTRKSHTVTALKNGYILATGVLENEIL